MSPRKISILLSLFCGYLLGFSSATDSAMTVEPSGNERKAFVEADQRAWNSVLFDSGTEDWRESWFLDGVVGTVTNDASGMTLVAGPEFGNDAHHMVLWTNDIFEGDIKIDYTYTRLDNETRAVTILYIQASGSNKEPYAEDIAEWSDLRTIPAMRTYYDNMHAYHISYAAFPNDADTTGYIRARLYVPHDKGLNGTGLLPDYYPKGLFEKGVPHQITVIKEDRDIFIRITNPSMSYYCHMVNPDLPPIYKGRIGLRHMYTRKARYSNFSISIPQTPAPQ
jgi:hypothetical protein